MSETGKHLREKILASHHSMAQTRAIGKNVLDRSLITSWHGIGVYNDAFFHYEVEENRPVGLLAALRLRKLKVDTRLLLRPELGVATESECTEYKLAFASAKDFDIAVTRLERPAALANLAYDSRRKGWSAAESDITPAQALEDVEGIVAKIGL